MIANLFCEYLKETKSINYSHPLVLQKIKELREKSNGEIDYIQKAYQFVRDEIPHSWDIKATIVSKNAGDVLKNQTGICWTKSCLLAALLRGNKIPSGISYQKLTRLDDTVYISELNKWIRLDARGNKSGVNAQFNTEKEMLAFPIRPQYDEIDYKDNNPDLNERLIKILEEADSVLEIRTDFELK